MHLLTPLGQPCPAAVAGQIARVGQDFLTSYPGRTFEWALEKATEHVTGQVRGQQAGFAAQQAEKRRIAGLSHGERIKELYRERASSFSTDPHQDRAFAERRLAIDVEIEERERLARAEIKNTLVSATWDTPRGEVIRAELAEAA